MDGYLGRITKARILEAVRESRGEAAAERLAPLKKGDMAEQAQALLASSGWLPTPLGAELVRSLSLGRGRGLGLEL